MKQLLFKIFVAIPLFTILKVLPRIYRLLIWCFIALPVAVFMDIITLGGILIDYRVWASPECVRAIIRDLKYFKITRNK